MQFFTEEANEELDKKSSGFYELQDGQNEFRIVSPFAWGYKFNFKNSAEGAEKEYPFYKTDDPEVAKNRSKLQLTAAMVVYDYATKELKPFNVHQKNILNAIREYFNNPKYGDPTGYDLVITKKGSGKETRYPSIMANPPEELSKEVQEALEKAVINVNNVYEKQPMIEAIER